MKHIQNQNRPPRGWTRLTALLLAALSGATVMVVELGVARILTPVFGGSISVWAIVISTTMLALAAGYAFGGYRADRTGGVNVACRAAIGAVLRAHYVPACQNNLTEVLPNASDPSDKNVMFGDC